MPDLQKNIICNKKNWMKTSFTCQYTSRSMFMIWKNSWLLASWQDKVSGVRPWKQYPDNPPITVPSNNGLMFKAGHNTQILTQRRNRTLVLLTPPWHYAIAVKLIRLIFVLIFFKRKNHVTHISAILYLLLSEHQWVFKYQVLFSFIFLYFYCPRS